MIPEDSLTAWNQKVPWKESLQVEQDLILTAMMQLVYADPFLAEKLALRGGTCLNKLFWHTPTRYSEDLDFVQIHGEKIGPTIKALRQRLDALFTEKPKWEIKRGGFRLYYAFQPTAHPSQLQRIKIEINTREHFAFEGFQKRPMHLESKWHSGTAEVTTFTPEELLATKLRALYQRRKGRDLFDLWKAQELKPKWNKVVTLFMRYMALLNKPIYRDLLVEGLQEKITDVRFQKDTESLILDPNAYDMHKAARFVIAKLYAQVPPSKTQAKKKRPARST